MAVYALGDQEPSIDSTAYIHPDAVVIGSVSIGPRSSVWPGAVLRGDDGEIAVGAETSIQDGSVIHTTIDDWTRIGDRCVIGHIVHMEACVVEDDALVGSGSVVLHRARICSWSIVAANSVVLNDKTVPSGAIAVGSPAAIKEGRANPDMIRAGVATYIERAERFRRELRRLD